METRQFVVGRLAAALLLLSLLASEAGRAESPDTGMHRIPVGEYHAGVHAAWLGQIVGNIYGLSYEFRYISAPGPDRFPYGYGESLQRVRQVDGAFSDDDTDIEYMYLLQMERHGIEPTYQQLAEAWKHHVRDKVWVANRAALNLMHAGYGPPLTGHRDYNPQWFQIDPQLVNEIWAVTAPGMVDYATAKSAWAARITSDGFGIEPTVHYAAMYSAAFFEKDIHRLIDIGTAALPAGSRFAAAVEHMKQLHFEYPDDWRAARAELARDYYYGDSAQQSGELPHGAFDYNRHAWPAVDATLNGACGILALLYGGGDFQRTLDIASGLGFDADNQAATMGGLLGIVHGLEGIPVDLLYPLGQEAWERPFNDRYVNVSRHDMPDASIRDLAARTARLGERVIFANGGRILTVGGVDYYEIDRTALFRAPFEMVAAPILLTQLGEDFWFRFYFGGDAEMARYRLAEGHLPSGLKLAGPEIIGTATETGTFRVRIEIDRDGERRQRDYVLRVLGENLAPAAQAVLHDESTSPDDIELIRDGNRRGRTFYNRATDSGPRVNFYGYRWEQPQRVAALWLNTGLPEEWGGWFTSLEVQYLDEAGDWRGAQDLHISPNMNFDNTQWLKGSYIDHLLSFEPVTTRAIRIIGTAGGIDQDARNGGERRHYTALSELGAYADSGGERR